MKNIHYLGTCICIEKVESIMFTGVSQDKEVTGDPDFLLEFFSQFSGVFPPKLCIMNRNYFYYDKDNTKAGFFPPPTPPKKVLVNILK